MMAVGETRRESGYYVDPQDWPTEAPRHNLSIQQIYEGLDRFDSVYGLAKTTPEQVEQANRDETA